MISGRFGTIAAGLTLAVLAGLSIRPPAPLPRIGRFLDPIHGVFGVARTAELPRMSRADLRGLEEAVEIRYDDRGVPHVFARNTLDATRALGYVVARDRLFQLELQARAGAGTLTELVGPAALGLDREMRELGLPDAAEARFRELGDTGLARAVLDAYADGVNAWIAGLADGDLPLEYQLLGRRPARWEPVNGLHLFNRMGWTLTRSDLEARQARARRLVGAAAADALYPIMSPIQEPIQPNGRSTPRETASRIPPPGAPDETAVVGGAPPSSRATADALGSNNWAVSPRRSATGHALLAGDPHLELTLPSIWYEVHLVVPDTLDAYGVTTPGAAGIVIGFTRELAWSFTNVEADLQDRYLEVVDDSLRPARYRLDGEWRPVRLREERYLAPGGRLLAVDTLRFTHRGPLRRGADGRWRSLRWTVLEARPAIEPLARATRARNAGEWLDEMAGWAAPPQNMLVADRAGTIAIRSTGRFPIRPTGRGDLEFPGDTSASDWTGDWPLAEMPQALNPAQGFLASANQQPVDPAVNPRYLGANWYSPWRALRINQLLRSTPAVSVDDMRRFQTDPRSAAAERFLPAFLAAARRFPGRDSLARAATLLGEWDGAYTVENERAVLFEAALEELQERLWDELAPGGAARGPSAPRPGLVVTWSLLADSASAWWDAVATGHVVERRDEILAEALLAGYRQAVARHGPPEEGGWRWGKALRAKITHLLHLRSLSELGVAVPGGTGTLSPLSEGNPFGASWRMVVELGDSVVGLGTYPGGQSGNPASSRYLDRLPLWREGRLAPLEFPRRAQDLTVSRSTLTLVPAR